MNDGHATTLEGRLEHITFYNGDTHYLIAKIRAKDTKAIISILGYMPEPNPGETLRVSGVWQTHPRYGQQFKFEAFEVLLPSSVDEIGNYLQSGIISGIGPKMVARIVAKFKDDTINVIENTPQDLAGVKGIGARTAQRIADEWQAHHAARSLMRFLQENEIKPAYGAKLMRLYGYGAEEILREDPLRVSVDLPGIGFMIATKIIQHSNISVDPEAHAKACLRHLLNQVICDGHLFEYEETLLTKARNIYEIEDDLARDALAQLSEENEIVVEATEASERGPAVYPAELHQFESIVAQRLAAALSISNPLPDLDPQMVSATVLKRLSMKLSDQQHQVLVGAVDQKVAIITGGPGTGKTTLIRSITAILESLGQRILLAAPTGRAARRISEVTDKPAATLHKLLGCNIEDGYFEKDQDDPLDADAVIVDEFSMVDLPLFYHLLKAVPLTSRLILVGDVFQLPSVGPGNVLADLIQSGRIPTFELTEIFRQAETSAIVLNAHRIRNGLMPEQIASAEETPSDFYFIEQGNPESVAKTVLELCAARIPEKFGLHAVAQIQVLTPMHKGVAGTLNLNRILQERLNPRTEKIAFMGGNFRVGDKVMHLRNNYHKEVFNGDIGIIADIDTEAEEILVEFYGRQVVYDATELDELALAYAISIHKSQGSEYPAIVVPILTQHYTLLQRNLLYTAVTRGKQLVVLIGTTKALAIALGNNKPGCRRSSLAARLEKAPVF